MIIAIDIGNTFTSTGIFNKNRLIDLRKFPTDQVQSNRRIFNLVSRNISKVDKVGISSVVPEMNHHWKTLFRNYFKLKPLFINTKIQLPLKLKIKNPANLGADRLCNAVAGYETYKRKQNVIVIDFGTATTYDVVLKNGSYLGGIILPGIETSAQSLYLKTSKLPLLTYNMLRFPVKPVGRNTKEAINSGIMYSALDSMEKMVWRIERSLKAKFKIIITGGLSGLIYKKTSLKVIKKDNMVLTGINYILSYNYGD